jgi:hypothetical protein
VQLIAPDNMRGRVMSIYMAFRGGMPLGSLRAATSRRSSAADGDRHQRRAPGRRAIYFWSEATASRSPEES